MRKVILATAAAPVGRLTGSDLSGCGIPPPGGGLLVSAIPQSTADQLRDADAARPRFVAEVIAYFRRQDYPNRELAIVHEERGDLPEIASGPDIRLVRSATPEASAPNAKLEPKLRGANRIDVGERTG
jgi:hypothetical protein